jgi:hypothetical protein
VPGKEFIMRTAEECRAKATAMDILALVAVDPATGEEYASLAAQWRLVARMADWQDEPLNHVPTLG